MSEGWEAWPILGPGWKRRAATRKSGASCGHTDTYYQSPTGMRIRSKIELAKFLGDEVDLSFFDFKSGAIISHAERNKPKRPSLPSEPAVQHEPKKPRVSMPLSTSLEPPDNNNTEEKLVVLCQGCKVWFAGVEFGKSKRTMWYCADCRAYRRAFNREQKYLKSVGCGSCAACKVPENCGYCTVCLLRSHNPEFGSSWKCVRRRCLQDLRKVGDCGTCEGCCSTTNCGDCSACIELVQNPGQQNKKTCLKRICRSNQEKIIIQPSDLKSFGTKKMTVFSVFDQKQSLVTKEKPPQEKEAPRSQRHAGRRQNRRCGECEACLQKVDCGRCDFCRDKPKFGGRNLKRQKCRWRQCLLFAMEKNIAPFLKSSKQPALLENLKQEAAETAAQSQDQDESHQIPLLKQDTSVDGLQGSCAGEAVTSQIVKEEEDDDEDKEGYSITYVVEEDEEPLNLHRSVKEEELVSEDDDDDDESTPVITEIFSLGAYQAMSGLDRVLQEFMTELIEIPLPAHWELLPATGPNIQLVQRSQQSTMADTVIHIQPGLHFFVTVKGRPLPSVHNLYSVHPSRLTTVDDVVELICDLEAYRPCPGVPKQGLLSAACHVLVYEGPCPECCKIPWPSGSDL
ncbi:methyl-CpG-binding domain protein 1 [Spea bombifrons]|uniref:methyl-CpG-binding domain protein 1 n=1 Tax=Spea bombifrons TaxID=233779 RepID=UPI002349395F|nr:methyl-CpG-binding domain protein 1 [Spea bombifrons]